MVSTCSVCGGTQCDVVDGQSRLRTHDGIPSSHSHRSKPAEWNCNPDPSLAESHQWCCYKRAGDCRQLEQGSSDRRMRRLDEGCPSYKIDWQGNACPTSTVDLDPQ